MSRIKELIEAVKSDNASHFQDIVEEMLNERIALAVEEKRKQILTLEYFEESFFAAMDAQEDTLNEGIPNPAFAAGQKFADLGKLGKDILGGKISKTDIADTLTSVYAGHKDDLEEIAKKYKAFLIKNSSKFDNPMVLAKTKPIKSLLDKVTARGKKLAEINDLVRGAVIFETRDEAEKFVKDLQRKHGDKIHEVEEKVKGGDLIYGYYGTFHLLIEIDGIMCELQVATKKLWKAKKVAHRLYTASRSSSTGPSKQDSYLSKKLIAFGNK